jgi:TRAP-type mannitol/chloroaromatic compound transport system substrate-binding protein
MNLDFFNSLTDHERAIIEAACMEENAAQPEEAMANNGRYLNKLVTEHGVQLRAFSDDVWDAFGEASAEVFEETRAHSDLAARIDDSYQAAMREIAGFRAIAEIEYSNQRNRVLGIT